MGLWLSLAAGSYALFIWLSRYGYQYLAMRVFEWIVPTAGLGLWAASSWRQRRAWPRTPIDLPILAWWAVTAWSVLFSVNRRVSLRAAWETVIVSLVFWLLVDLMRRGGGSLLWKTLYLLTGAVCLVSGLEMAAWYFGWPIFSFLGPGWFPIGGLSNLIPPVLHRLAISPVNGTSLAALMALLIPPALSVGISAQARDTRIGAGLWLGAAVVTMLLSLTRGGFVALGASLPLFILGASFDPRIRHMLSAFWARRMGRLALIGALVLGLGGLVGGGLALATRMASHQSGDLVRLDQFRSALAVFRDHPWTGVGAGAFGTAWRLYQNPLFARDQLNWVHSLYLNVAAETGLPGLLVGGWLLWTLVWLWYRRWRAAPPGSTRWWQLLGIGAALAGLAVQSTVDYFFFDPAILLPVCLWVACILFPEHPSSAPQPGWRWAWAGVGAFLLLSAAPLAWDDWGYSQMTVSLAAMQRGDLPAAQDAVRRAIQRDPSMGLYACQSGYVYGLQVGTGDEAALDQAIEQYQRCVYDTQAPGWADQLNLAALLVQAGRVDEAQALLDQAVERAPLQPLVWLNHGILAEQAGQWAEAVRDYAWVLRLEPSWAGSPFWRDGARSARWDDIIAYDGQIDLAASDWRWQVLAAAEQWTTLAQETRAWLEQAPDDANAMFWLGKALHGQGDAAALEWLSRAVELAPTNGAAWVARGDVWLERGQVQAADADFGMALFLNPADPAARLGRARLARLRGDDQQAMREYRQALSPYLVIWYGYDIVLYDRLGWPAPLPQVMRLTGRLDGEVAHEFAAWLQARGDEAAAHQVYDHLERLDAFWKLD